MLNLGILASSYQVAAGLATFATGANFGTVVSNSLAFVNGTAVLDANGTGSRYSTDLYTTTTLGGATIDTPNSSWGANGVVLKTGRDAAGTITIARTSDGGQTWATALNAASTGDRIEAVAYGDVSGTARWIAPVHGDNDVYLSTDNGATFSLQSNVLAIDNWRAATRMGSAFAVFAYNSTAYYTSAIGTTWTLRTLPAITDQFSNYYSRAFASSSDTTMYLSQGSVVYTTSDLVNWTLQGTVPINATASIQAAGITQGNGYWVAGLIRRIGSGGGAIEALEVYYSNNNGVSWSSSTVQGTGTTTTLYDLAFNSSDNGFYITGGTGGATQTMRVWRGLS